MTSHQHSRQAGLAIAFAALIAVAQLATLRAQAPAGQAGGRSAAAPGEALFTSAQAAAGKVAYQRNCASCHGALVDNGDSAPPLRGAAFLGKYAGKPVADLFTYVSTNMPAGNPGSLGGAEYAQIIAYVLQQNNFATGRKEFASDAAALASVTFPAPPGGRGGGGGGGGVSPGVKLPPAPKKANPLDKITPVTDAMLQNPPPGEWLTWRRGFDDQGSSPLKQITKSNVNNLRVAWTWTLSPGANEATPLVHDGVMFLHSPGDKLQALDATTGDLLWQYARILPPGVNAGNKRHIAIYGKQVYMGTSDLHVVALDVKTGRVVCRMNRWPRSGASRSVAAPWCSQGQGDDWNSSAVASPAKNYIVALDAETGKLAWRFNTIAQPGEPGGDTWNDHKAEERNGGSVWIAGSYDSALNLAFFGVAQTYDTALLVKPVRPGVNTDGLYTDCTLAINPDTGKLVWFYQHLPNDQWDLDWVFERQVVRMPVNGVVRPVVMTSGKQATYDILDAETGKYIFSKDLGLQNIVTSIDPSTGKKTINPQTLPGDGQAHMVCPHVDGAKSWLPGSYNPDTKILYVPLVEACMDLTPVTDGGRPGLLSAGGRPTVRPRPDSDGKYGRVEAINMLTREVVWTTRNRAPVSSGALDTAGGVIFNGSIDRYFRAYDDQTGNLLWETRLSDVPSLTRRFPTA